MEAAPDASTAAPSIEATEVPAPRSSVAAEAQAAPTTEVPVETPAAADAAEMPPRPTVASSPAYDFSGTALPPAPVGVEGLAAVDAAGPRPVSLAIDDIGVAGAGVVPVGVNPDRTFEVPPADQVGWYRFGPSPGDAGSAVLAAHIAFDGVDGVFRRLADVEVGAIVRIGFDDGSTGRYRIESVTEYLKQELPAELFARTGDTQLALITCGGTFNRQLSSYESNVVAVAIPI